MYVNVLKMVPQSYATVKNTTGYKILTERNMNISSVMPPKQNSILSKEYKNNCDRTFWYYIDI